MDYGLWLSRSSLSALAELQEPYSITWRNGGLDGFPAGAGCT